MNKKFLFADVFGALSILLFALALVFHRSSMRIILSIVATLCLLSGSVMLWRAHQKEPVRGNVSIMLKWDASTDSTVVGYQVWQGDFSRSYTNVIDVGSRTSFELHGLVSGTTNYFSVTAYDMLGIESKFSEEQVYVAP